MSSSSLRASPGWISSGAALAAIVPVLLAPLLVPAQAHLGRALVTGYAISVAMKLRLLVAGRADPAMMATWPRRLLWTVTPQATFWTVAPDERRAIRWTAPRLFGRALVAALLMMAAAAAKAKLNLTARGWPALTALEMVQFFLLLCALGDNAAGIAALAGARAQALFRNPLAARSPSEFWSRRWNLVVHDFARRQVFVPLARRWGGGLALAGTFALSGLMHEYLVLACLGLAQYRPGWMMAFFAAQGLAVGVTIRAGRRLAIPVALGASLHLAWLLTTSPLFFAPLRSLVTAFDRACITFLGALLPVT